MLKRGRKSAAEEQIAPLKDDAAAASIAAPAELTPEEREEWREIVDVMPADWFRRETHPLLADYCRHVCFGRRIWQRIATEQKKKKVDLDQLERLQKMADRQTRVIASLATKMRLSQQTFYDKKKTRGRAAGGPKLHDPV